MRHTKQRDFDKAQKRAVDRFKQRFGKEVIRKQSRQTQLCTKVPPSKKRSFFGGSGPCHYFSNLKGNLMKKAKMEYLNSHEAKVHAAMRKKDLQRNQCAPRTTTTAFLSKKTKPQSQISLGRLQGLNSSSVPPRTVTPNNIFRKDFASSSKPAKSLRRV
ncbi:hypothetical protein Scep_017389 [Stephania cephalantha]|uniref:Uncharacterized protein n=1 Tax=Stephania cephalantha TaxID=152367 RepID=A0AAP0IR81_9MAGN